LASIEAPRRSLLGQLFRGLALTLVRLYYPVRQVSGREHLPRGPAIFVLNHPNALLDPLVLCTAARRRLYFLGKSTLFAHPLARFAVQAFDGVPVYRARDVAGDTRKGNELTFALCRDLLARGEAIALFPEGTSHSDPSLKPVKTGAARLALSALELAPTLVPVGLFYEAKETFRSRVHVTVGPPLAWHDLAPLYTRDPEAAVDELTTRIAQGLDGVVVQAETRELLTGVAQVASWIGAPGERKDLAATTARAQRMIDAYRTLQLRDPAKAELLVREARRYGRVLSSLGIRDPWALEVERLGIRRSLLHLTKLLALLPAALVGALLDYVPYRLAGRLARRVATEEDVLGTVRLLAGALVFLIAWLTWPLGFGGLFGWPVGLAVGVAGPLGGYAALRVTELLATTRGAAQYLVLRQRHPDMLAALRQRRQALADAITTELA
jgi:glycerol-3-phosphate O-acyltransferase / dihydroxyacetone phosphate acyltransferase